MRSIVRSCLAWLALVGAARVAGAQAGVPSTDIYLAPLSIVHGRPVIGTPVNITHRAGYDNQPAFTPDGRAILFTSIHDDGQADIYRYDLRSRAVSRVTSTPESEYSPTVMPGGRRFSVIRVEPDSTQRLWSFAMDGSDPRLVLTDVKPVGYQAWLDDRHLALFVLGSPNALVIADARGTSRDTIARDIGRSLVTVPGSAAFTYLQHRDFSWSLVRVNGASSGPPSMTTVAPMPRGADYVIWLSPRLAITATGSSLFAWSPGEQGWTAAADLSAAGMQRPSRLAVSPNGKWLAIVAEPGAR